MGIKKMIKNNEFQKLEMEIVRKEKVIER